MPTPSDAQTRRHTRPRVGDAAIAGTRALGGFLSLKGIAFETKLRPHVHSSYVLGVVEDGAVHITMHGTSAVAVAGSVVAIPPFAVHTELPVAPGGWSFRYLYPGEAIINEVLGRAPRDGGTSLHFPSPVIEDPLLASAITQLDDHMRTRAPSGLVERHVIDVVRALARHACTARVPRVRERQNVQAVRAMLTARPHEHVSLASMAEAAGLSPFHFLRVFRSEVGLTPYAYFEQVRVAYANEMICAGLDIAAVAYRLGYSDQSHLNRHFSRGSFTTPGRLSRLASTVNVRQPSSARS